LARVLLCEHDSLLAKILMDLFADEHIVVTTCASLEEIEAALDDNPGAVIVTDSWTDSWCPDLSSLERATIARLAERTQVVVTTGRAWANKPADAGLGPQVAVISKPYDLDELVRAVRSAASAIPREARSDGFSHVLA
jgi:DNA-binding NtrC family response regulator